MPCPYSYMNQEPQIPAEDDITGLPLLPTWHRVYWFVFGVFITYVVLLMILARAFA